MSDYETLQMPPRPAKEALDRTPPAVLAYIEALEALLVRALEMGVKQGERIEALEKEVRAGKRKANRRMVERLRSCHDAVVRSLRDLRVPATNNHAERQVRPSVVTRKRGGCNCSQRGVRAFEVITRLLVSARQRKINVVDYLVNLLRQDPLQPEVAFW